MSWNDWAESVVERARTTLQELATSGHKEQLDSAEEQGLLTHETAPRSEDDQDEGNYVSKEGQYDIVSISVSQWRERPTEAESVLELVGTTLRELATPWDKEQLDWAQGHSLLDYGEAPHPGFIGKYGPKIWGKDKVYDVARLKVREDGQHDVLSIYMSQWGERQTQIAVAVHLMRELGYPPSRVVSQSGDVDIEVFDDDRKQRSLMHVEIKVDPQELEESIDNTLRRSADGRFKGKGKLYDRLLEKKPKYALWVSRPKDGSAGTWDTYVKRAFKVKYDDDDRAMLEEVNWDKVPNGPGWSPE